MKNQLRSSTMKLITISVCLAVVFLIAQGFEGVEHFSQSNKDIEKAEWLLGTWENKTSRGSLYETWARRSQHEFFGMSYRVRERDTVVFETIQLLQRPEGLFYIPTVRNQNQGMPVTFALKSMTDTGMVFENPGHDFPQIISYSRITPDSLVAEISGTRNGTFSSQSFPMKRMR
jgi:hypothetical protein